MSDSRDSPALPRINPHTEQGFLLPTTVVLPALGDSITEGTVTRWLKAVGERVELGEPLLEVSTDKVDTEIPSPVAGTLLSIEVEEDDTLGIGGVLAMIAADLEEAVAEQIPASAPELPSEPMTLAQERVEALAQATPLEQPSQYSASGLRSDALPALVESAAAEPTAPASTGLRGLVDSRGGPDSVAGSQLRGTVANMSRLRKIIATRMVESLRVSAQLTSVVEVDVTAVSNLRDSVKDDFTAREGIKLTFLPFFAKAALEALKQNPVINAQVDIDSGQITYHADAHLAIAVDTDRGLLTPVIKQAGRMTVAELARAIADVADRTRTNKISPDDLSGGTFTLTNTGSRGALFDTPILNQPQVGILGVGAVVKRPVVVRDEILGNVIAIRDMVYLAITYDHRIVDGADAARYLSQVKRQLEQGKFTV